MNGTFRLRIAAILILVVGMIAGAVAVADFVPQLAAIPGIGAVTRPYRLGLDLQGGTHLLYRADFSSFAGASPAEAMDGLRDVIERRVNLFGVTEPVVQVERSGDEYRLAVELAGVRDINEAIRQIGETPFLEFKEPRPEAETQALLERAQNGEEVIEDPFFQPTELTGRYLERADLQFDPTTNAPLISVQFTDEGAALFEVITARNVGRPIGIYLDGAPLSTPVVSETITGGRAQITGQFTVAEARELVRRLNAGALPVPITLVNQQTVEASLGKDSLQKSLAAVVVGFLAVAVFMLFWYRLPGLIAVLALVIYAAIMLLLFKAIPVTLTAAGIAGFILSIGMAVDANILIFERMREELERGRDLPAAIREGFARAWTSIRDSNVSSLITALILYWLGQSAVRGFALTLGIGVLISMLSAITVSRTFLFAALAPRLGRARWLFTSGFARGIAS
ncbi:protein translocase subunit SecD [Candidatus Parcubacteria bacterium]|nr:MAG: protein translocase subunit SecD [Candidatus Parcubacteria bacterium]